MIRQQCCRITRRAAAHPTYAIYAGTPRITLDALNIAVTLLPISMPRSVLLWLVMMAAIVPPRGKSSTTSVLTAPVCTRVTSPADGARLHARHKPGQLVARGKARPCAVRHEDDRRRLDQRKRFRSRHQAQARAAALCDDGDDVLATGQFQGHFIVDGTLF